MLDKNQFVVKEQAKLFSSRKAYDILDSETGQPLGLAKQHVSGLMSILGLFMAKDKIPVTIEFRSKADDSLVFAVRRRGFLIKKVEAVDAKKQLVGRYKSKRFSLAGGFHIYDKNGKHAAEIRGKLLKSEYKILTPSGTEMGSVSKKWGGLGRELFTSADTYLVTINPEFASNPDTKMQILGAAIAIDAFFSSGKASGGKNGAAEADGDDE